MVKKYIVSAAEEALGRGRKKQPDCLMEVADTLLSLVKTKIHTRVLYVC